MNLRKALIFVVSALTIWACAYSVNPVTGRREAYGYSWDEEVRIGRETDAQIVAQYGIYGDEKVAAYVSEVGEAMLAESHMRRAGVAPMFRGTKFTFRVLDSPVVNAFALPGGYVYVSRGLLAHLVNEAQLAVVIGHEIGHVVGRHASRRALKSKIGQIGLLGGAILGQRLGIPASDILEIGGMATQYLFLSYSRDDERESDRLGVEYAAMGGYRSADAAAFFESLKRITERAGARIPAHRSTHPDPGERERTIPRLASEWARQGHRQTEDNQDRFYEAIEGIVLGDDPRQGFVESDVFFHPAMRFLFPLPAGWHTVNEPSGVQVVEPEGKCAIFLRGTDARSPEEAAAKLEGRRGVTIVGRRALEINGLTARQVRAEATSRGRTIALVRTYIALDETVFEASAMCAKDDYGVYGEHIMRSIGGFSRLRDPEALATQPVRVRVVTVEREAPLASLLPETLPASVDAESIAILNQMDLDEVAAAGSRVKLPAAP